MRQKLIDLRSDTVTRPSADMRRIMAEADVGDDVYGDDPSVNALQEGVAALLGKEAAIFVPSGTMANQIAIGLHTKPGDELLCHESYHVNLWEQGAIARLWGVSTRTVAAAQGILAPTALEAAVRPLDVHFPTTRLVCLENTLNRMGGQVYPFEAMAKVSAWARGRNLAVHLDGARLFNAVVATGIAASQWSGLCDTVSVCFSKGLGAPVGSALAGSKEQIAQARRLRKVLGGGMRQAGILAKAAHYALEHHLPKLRLDHEHAALIARAIASTPGLALELGPVETNLVWFTIDSTLGSAAAFAAWAKSRGFLVSSLGAHLLRVSTHLDVSRQDAEAFADLLLQVSPAQLAPFSS